MPPSPSIRPQGAEPPIRDRGDACPGALRLHSAADGHLARVRLPAGDLTVRQAEALADAADRLGDGHLSLTSRGNAELRGLADGCGGRLAALLRDAGLLPSESHERVRNILASPLAGLDRHTPSDVRLWARELDGLLCASESATALSGRFLFVLDDGRGDVAALGGDVSLVAERGGAGSGGLSEAGCPAGAGGTALLRVGDDPAALRIAGPDAPRAALTAAAAFLTAAAASGSGAWRVRELPDGHGLTVRAVAERLRAAGIGCAEVAGEVAAAVAGAGDVTGTPDATGAPAPASVPYADSSAPGVIEGSDGARALSVLAPLGRLSVAQWRLLTAVAAEDGAGALRLTPWRGVVIPGLSADTAAPRLRELSAAGLVTDPDSPWHRVGACTGRPGCAKSRTDVRADATAAVTAGAPVPGEPGQRPALRRLPVYWSGCERRCGHPHGAWVDVLATAEGYRVSVVQPQSTPAPHPAPAAPSAAPCPATS
ncbi:precorrin-3B synthase [Streptomyces sp. SID8375]|uniref:precorrin-3B synthase n=1 Tax=unclassified Streptomyces TaxID=2593676 RepID=UPI000D0AB7F1|nr:MULTISPECIES: precorrin-3B synthase [unclassified Streptomyces]MYX06290.1 precorrin-3B synthase [Streptomyces sp. SID8375]